MRLPPCRRLGGDRHSGLGGTSRPDLTGEYETDPTPIRGILARIAANCSSACRASRARTGRDRGGGGDPATAGRGLRESFLAARMPSALSTRLTRRRSRFLRLDELCMRQPQSRSRASSRLRRGRGRSRSRAGRQGRRRGRPGHPPRACSGRAERGSHLCHAMLLPRRRALRTCRGLAADGAADLGPARLERRGKAVVHLTASNPRFLNAEDDSTLELMETGGRRRDPRSGLGNRGAARRPGRSPEIPGPPRFRRRDQPDSSLSRQNPLRVVPASATWATSTSCCAASPRRRACPTTCTATASRSHGSQRSTRSRSAAIARCCSRVDYVLAARDAFMTLPARKEGIIPGLANLRLPRFTGDRIARQAIQYERRLPCDSPEGRLICDEIVPPREMDAPSNASWRGLTTAGRGQRGRQPPRLPRRAGAARSLPPLLLGLCARAGLLPLQPGADRQPRAQLERRERRL